MPLSPIQGPIKAADEAPPPPPRTLRLPFDPLLTLAVLGLAACSLVTLGAATRNLVPGNPHYYVDRQAVYLGVGLVGMVDPLARSTTPACGGSKTASTSRCCSASWRCSASGTPPHGAQRAINFPLFSFQASELGKVLLIVALSALVVDRARRLRERDTTIRVMIAALIPAMFVIAQPDLGSGMVYMVIAYMLLFIAGTSWRHLAALAALVAVSIAFVLVAAPAAGVHVLKPYQVERLTAFLHPSSEPAERGLPAAGVEDRDRLRPEDRARAKAATRPPTGSCPRATPISSSRRSASATASSAPGSCCCSTRC